jgi:MFS family permease
MTILPMQAPQISEWRNGWRVLTAAAVGIGAGYNLFMYTASLFILPMQAEFGWTRSELALGSMVGLLSAFIMPITGWLTDRFGARPLGLAGLVAMAACYVGLALAPPSRAIILSLVCVIAVVSPLSSPVSFTRGLLPYFRRHTGSAVAIAMSGISVAAFAVVPLVAIVIADWGWRTSYFALAAILMFAALPVVFLWFREKPADASPAPRRSDPLGELRGVAADRRFWFMVFGFGGASVLIGGSLSQMQPLLVSYGLSSFAATALVTCYAVTIGIGRLCAGFLLDRINPTLVARSCLLLASFGGLSLVMMPDGAPLPLIAVAIMLIGFGHGAESDFIVFFSVRIFGEKIASTIFGVMAFVISIGMAAGGLFYAQIFDRYGSYRWAIGISVTLMVAAAVLIGRLRLPGASKGLGEDAAAPIDRKR